ncbi:F0F1 ATP synthase subunit gamma [Thermomonospora cellulosilytica]|uniref:ATP synthase gamma chain n=1 Tax=Thermomonospora cellulosilytica TaxID=1411118 RepID=A0A7W3RBS0_9ACTN|nr:F0F1 ATP synthase subunit gamma [Thermomonospora cellulosilytica]MBA9007708.1 F-type H+-transporting ATPase subunit gamma [Thermomonospora cellulosilytica]
MGAQLRQLRRQIRSVKSTAKITRAQEMIATSRIVKAQQAVESSKPYADQITRALTALVSHNVGIDHPLLREQPEDRRSAVLVITSDRGFCGAYNANVIREAEALMARLRERGREPVPYVIGNKGITWYRFRDRELAAEWSGISDRPDFASAEQIGRRLTADFIKTEAGSGGGDKHAGGVGEIHVVYTEFVSMLTQQVQVRRLLPLEIEETTSGQVLPAYEFEPSAQAALDLLLPNYVESRVFHMLLQSAASFHAAVRRAMKSATDNANELIGVYTRMANQARQAEITQEISEIVGGADALAESSAGSE